MNYNRQEHNLPKERNGMLSQANENEIIKNILLDSSIIHPSDKINFDWEEMIRDDLIFFKNNKFIINFLHQNITKSIANKWAIVALLKIFLKQNFLSEEVLNSLFMINNTLKHLYYFDKLFTNKNYCGQSREIDEHLTQSYFNMNNNFFFLLNNYKTKYSEKGINDCDMDNDIYYKDFSDKRRECFLDEKGYFNYINYRCPYTSHDERDVNCPYSHNDKELLYHPLNLKTRVCWIKTNCLGQYCSLAHNLHDDFRFIYSPDKALYKKISLIFRKLDLFSNIFDNNINENVNNNSTSPSLPSEFHIDTYKTIECPLGTSCKLDTKLCLNYHNLLERRRDPRRNKYSARHCEYTYSNGKWKNPLNCRLGDACPYTHNIYEYLYSPEIFRQRQCGYESQGRACEYLLICPYNHTSDIRDVYTGICYNKETVEYYAESIKSKISEEFEKLRKLQAILEQHKCPICKNEYAGCYVKLSCGDIVCKECSDSSLKGDNQKTCRSCKKTVEGAKEYIIKKEK